MVLAMWIGLAVACVSALLGPRVSLAPSHVQEIRSLGYASAQTDAEASGIAGSEAASEGTEEQEEEQASSLDEDALVAVFGYTAPKVPARRLPRLSTEVRCPPAESEPDTPPPRHHAA
jgi:hypothetical protein